MTPQSQTGSPGLRIASWLALRQPKTLARKFEVGLLKRVGFASLLLPYPWMADALSPPGPVAATNAIAATEAAVESLDSGLTRELDNLHWQGAPVYLVVVANPTTDRIPLKGIEPLRHFFQKLDRFDLLPRELDLRCHPSRWDLPDGTPMALTNDNARILRATEAFGKPAIEFDYSGLLQGGPIQVRSDGPVDFTLLFSTTNLPPGKAQTFKAFRLMVVDASKAPEPRRLSRNFLNPNAKRWPETLVPSIRKRLEQFHFAGGATNWQLRPFVGTNEANASYLYEGWRSQDMPPFGAELDFAAVKRRLDDSLKNLNAATVYGSRALDFREAPFKSTADAGSPAETDNETDNEPERLKKKAQALENEAEILEAAVDQRRFGGTNTAFSARAEERRELAARKRKEAADLEKEAAARQEQAAARQRRAKELQRRLAVAEAGRKEEIRKVQQRLDAMPDSVEHTAYVGLFAVGPNVRLEVIRFSDDSTGNPP